MGVCVLFGLFLLLLLLEMFNAFFYRSITMLKLVLCFRFVLSCSTFLNIEENVLLDVFLFLLLLLEVLNILFA